MGGVSVVSNTSIELTRVSKRFGEMLVIDDLTLTIPGGQITCLLGVNGAGKTTLLSLLAGFRRSDSGSILLGSRPPGQKRGRDDVAVAVQSPHFPEMLTVSEIVEFVRAHKPEERSDPPALKLIDSLWDRKCGSLSGGQAQSLALACALVREPTFLLLDEPTSSLDTEATQLASDQFEQRRDEGATIVVATHDLSEVARLADQIVALHGGRVAVLQSISELEKSASSTSVSFVADEVDPTWSAQFDSLRLDASGRWTVATDDPDQVVRSLVSENITFSALKVEETPLEAVLAEVVASAQQL